MMTGRAALDIIALFCPGGRNSTMLSVYETCQLLVDLGFGLPVL